MRRQRFREPRRCGDPVDALFRFSRIFRFRVSTSRCVCVRELWCRLWSRCTKIRQVGPLRTQPATNDVTVELVSAFSSPFSYFSGVTARGIERPGEPDLNATKVYREERWTRSKCNPRQMTSLKSTYQALLMLLWLCIKYSQSFRDICADFVFWILDNTKFNSQQLLS